MPKYIVWVDHREGEGDYSIYMQELVLNKAQTSVNYFTVHPFSRKMCITQLSITELN